MVLVSNPKKFVFLKTRKTAGTSIEMMVFGKLLIREIIFFMGGNSGLFSPVPNMPLIIIVLFEISSKEFIILTCLLLIRSW